MMRFDPRIMINSEDSANLNSIVSSLISACLIKGLDIAGFVSDNPQTSQVAVNLAREQNVDLYVLPGTSYKTVDGFSVVIYNKPDIYTPGLTIEQVLADCQKNHYISLVYNLGKQTSGKLLKLGEGKDIKATFVEILNAQTAGYQYIPTNTFEVMSSGVETANDIERNNIYSHVSRKDMEERGVIPAGQGTDYVPNYLQNVN
jgi:hypothetical protein